MLKNKKKNDPCIRVHQQIYWITVISAHFAHQAGLPALFIFACFLCPSLDPCLYFLFYCFQFLP